jgi:hypothetical protein
LSDALCAARRRLRFLVTRVAALSFVDFEDEVSAAFGWIFFSATSLTSRIPGFGIHRTDVPHPALVATTERCRPSPRTM